MSIIKSITDRVFRAYAGLGSINRLVTAQRVIPLIGIGGAIAPGTAGAGGAGVAIDLAALDLRGRDVYISAEGIVRFRLGAAPDAANWHFSVLPGQTLAFHVPDDATTIQGWGVGAAWNFCLVPIDQET